MQERSKYRHGRAMVGKIDDQAKQHGVVFSVRKERKKSEFEIMQMSESQVAKITKTLGSILVEHCR